MSSLISQERRCIELLVYHIDGILTRGELIFHLSSLDPAIVERFPDSSIGVYPPLLEESLKQEIIRRKNVT